MGTVLSARPAQTLYVTIRRDELRQIKDEREQLIYQVAQLRQQLQALGFEDLTPRALVRSPD
jgi:parvulin-like peptidyl-prolyl isomerase